MNKRPVVNGRMWCGGPCGRHLPLSRFGFWKAKGRYLSYCRDCQRVNQRESRRRQRRNPKWWAIELERKRAAYAANPEPAKARKRAWYAANREDQCRKQRDRARAKRTGRRKAA